MTLSLNIALTKIPGRPYLSAKTGKKGTMRGHYGLKYLNSMEYLNLSKLKNGWRLGPDLPFGVGVPKLVASLDRSSLYAIGGEALARFGRTKYKKINMGILECLCKGQHFSRYDCEWFILAQRLNHHRMNSIAIMIPDSLVDTLCKQN